MPHLPGSLVVVEILAFLVLLTIFLGVRIVPQGYKHVVQRLGKYHATLNPGRNFVIPYLDSIAHKVLTKDISLDIPTQEVITRDNAVIMTNTEGYPDLALDIYGSTLLIQNYADEPIQSHAFIQEVTEHMRSTWTWLRAGILKTRNARTQEEKNGKLIFGEKPDTKIKEDGIWYAVSLTMNRDASFYLDTPTLRKWLIENMRGKTVLNTFAYTGSLGVAAMAGGASRVVQTDLNRHFLNLGKDSYSLNGFPIERGDFIAQDFFNVAIPICLGWQVTFPSKNCNIQSLAAKRG